MMMTVILLAAITVLVSIGYLMLRGQILNQLEAWQKARAEKEKRLSRDLKLQAKREEAMAYVLSEMQRQEMPHEKAA